jgi:plastocyanin
MLHARSVATAARLAATAARLAATAIALAGLPAWGADHLVVTTASNGFSPATLTIAVGDTVTFRNDSGGFHDAAADDGSFRCANGCDGDGHGGDGSPSTAGWSATVAFNHAGTVSYHCETHGAMGMVGSITVAVAGGSAGTLAFSAATFTVAENGGSKAIAVQRTGGSTGAVSVHYATSDGTAIAGQHYTATAGTLSWADGDAAAKSFSVPVLDDGVADGTHTANLALTAPAGGAVLGRASAALAITDADGGTPGPPGAPSGLTAVALDTTTIQLSWHAGAGSAADFRVQSKPLDGSPFQDVSPTVPGGTTSLAVSGLLPATGYGFRVRAENSAGSSPFTAETDAATSAVPAPCIADANTLCLGAGGRFQVGVVFKAPGGTSTRATAVPLAAHPDSGLFYFFGPGNIEMLIKVLNACAPPFNHYWVFFAATTNVQFTVTVTDTASGKVQAYFNLLNQSAAPVEDTSAFATCP